jgi:spore germination cell wall hydrolase CwlJ-like protein
VVADCLYFEARGEGRQGIEAVASVIQNRSKESGRSLEAVCLAPRQFSCFNGGYVPAKPRNELERAILAFCEGLERQMRAGEFRSTVKATFYFSGKKPYWYGGFRVEKVIGRHTFMINRTCVDCGS